MHYHSLCRSIIKAFDISPLQARVSVVEYSNYAINTIEINDYAAKTPLLCAIDELTYSGKLLHIVHYKNYYYYCR